MYLKPLYASGTNDYYPFDFRDLFIPFCQNKPRAGCSHWTCASRYHRDFPISTLTFSAMVLARIILQQMHVCMGYLFDVGSIECMFLNYYHQE